MTNYCKNCTCTSCATHIERERECELERDLELEVPMPKTMDCLLEIGDQKLLIHKPVVISFDTLCCDIYPEDQCDCCNIIFNDDFKYNLKVVVWAWGDAEPTEKLQLLSFKLCDSCYDFNNDMALVTGETLEEAVHTLCRPGDLETQAKLQHRRKQVLDAGITTPNGVVPVDRFFTHWSGTTDMWDQEIVINHMRLSLKFTQCDLIGDDKCDCCMKSVEETYIKYMGWENRDDPSFNHDMELVTFKLCQACYDHNKNRVVTCGKCMWDALDALVKP